MSAPLFYIPTLATGHLLLDEAEAKHAAQVLRLKIGDPVHVTNGAGKRASAFVELISKKQCILQVDTLETIPAERPARIHMAIAPTKSIDRYEWFLEKACEIGVDRITPLITAHSERKRVRHDRSLKVLIAAMKQCQRSWLPQLDELTSLNDFLVEELPEQKYFGWCEGIHRNFMQTYSPNDCLMLIGPEGDFSSAEATLLQENGFTPVSIGNTRLRTETAAVAACSWMSLYQQK